MVVVLLLVMTGSERKEREETVFACRSWEIFWACLRVWPRDRLGADSSSSSNSTSSVTAVTVTDVGRAVYNKCGYY